MSSRITYGPRLLNKKRKWNFEKPYYALGDIVFSNQKLYQNIRLVCIDTNHKKSIEKYAEYVKNWARHYGFQIDDLEYEFDNDEDDEKVAYFNLYLNYLYVGRLDIISQHDDEGNNNHLIHPEYHLSSDYQKETVFNSFPSKREFYENIPKKILYKYGLLNMYSK